MNSRDVLKQASEELRASGVPDPEFDSAWMLSEMTGIPPLNLRAGMNIELTEDMESGFHGMVSRRKEREPLQYLLGSAVFCGTEFLIGQGVLIPRPETELLAEWTLERLRDRPEAKVLDLCCGSGCLGLTIARRIKGAEVTLTDLSPDALRWAERNRDRLGLRCEILCGDLFSTVRERKFDCVVSNPPYIPTAECGSLQPEVLREPEMALDGGADGLDFYRRIAAEVPGFLNPGGFVMMEVGSGQAESVSKLMDAAGAGKTEIRNDYAGIPRMVLGEY